MVPLLCAKRFWEPTGHLTTQVPAFVNYRLLMGQLGKERAALSRRLRLTADRLLSFYSAARPGVA